MARLNVKMSEKGKFGFLWLWALCLGPLQPTKVSALSEAFPTLEIFVTACFLSLVCNLDSKEVGVCSTAFPSQAALMRSFSSAHTLFSGNVQELNIFETSCLSC